MSARQPHELMLAATPALTMTSREIATVTGKDHKNVTADIAKMLAELDEDALTFQRIYLDSMNRKQTEYVLDRELTDTLMTGYSAVLRRKVIARWRELESAVAAPALPNFADPAAAARAWADEVDAKQIAVAKVVQLQHQVAEQAPAVAGLDRIANAAGTMCVSDAAKVLQMQPSRLTDLLLTKKWIYHRPGKPGYLAYQDRLQSGNLKHKLGSYTDPDTGDSKVKEQVLVTRKGLTNLAKIIAIDAAEKRLAETAGQHQHQLAIDPDQPT